jgi:hypothetical protein
MIKPNMEDFDTLIVYDKQGKILGTIVVPVGVGYDCDEDELEGRVERWRPTFCSDAAEVKRVLGWHKLR